jgi:4'-phosphopantetheinyl transferase
VNVYLLEQREADVAAHQAWLSAGELLRLSEMRFPKRRADWRLGRWTAKRAVAAYLNQPLEPRALARVEIRPEPSGAPKVFVGSKAAAVCISLTHRGGAAACAVAPARTAVGCDLETIEPRSDAFAADYFTAEERAMVARARAVDRPLLLALLWSAKESALKALRVGLRMDTRSVVAGGFEAPCSPGAWLPLHVHCGANRMFHGWWRYTDRMLLTVVADPPPARPAERTRLLQFETP